MSIFNDTKVAFQDKTTAQLKKAFWMFKTIEQPQLTSFGIKILNFTIENNFPLLRELSVERFSNNLLVVKLAKKVWKL